MANNNTRFQPSDLYEAARKALTRLCAAEGPEQCERALEQALGQIERNELEQRHRALDSLPEGYFEHDALNIAYALRRHQDVQLRRG